MLSRIATIVAGLLLVLAAQVGVTAAATGKSGAGEAVRGRVVIDCEGTLHPPGVGLPVRTALGRCTISGAIADRGKFVDDAAITVHPHERTVHARKGTIRMSVYLERGHWEITGGTKAYAGLRGRGWESNSGRCGVSGLGCAISITMTGRVSQ